MAVGEQNVADILGPLQPLFDEYCDTVANAPAEPVVLEYYDAILPDKVEAVRKSLPVDVSEEEKLALIDKAKHFEVPGKRYALNSAGFVGTVNVLFERTVALQTEGTELDESTLRQLDVLKVVPAEQQKGANICSDGYYYGGLFNRVER